MEETKKEVDSYGLLSKGMQWREEVRTAQAILMEVFYSLTSLVIDEGNILFPVSAEANVLLPNCEKEYRSVKVVYDEARIIKAGSRTYAISLGLMDSKGLERVKGSAMDIVALEISTEKKSKQEISDEVFWMLRRNENFKNSLLIAYEDSTFAFNFNGPWCLPVCKFISRDLDNFTSLDTSKDNCYLIKPSKIFYKRGLEEALEDLFRNILSLDDQ